MTTTNLERCEAALQHIRDARDLLKAAGALKASGIASSAIPSIEAAIRNARAQDRRKSA